MILIGSKINGIFSRAIDFQIAHFPVPITFSSGTIISFYLGLISRTDIEIPNFMLLSLGFAWLCYCMYFYEIDFSSAIFTLKMS